MGHAAEARARTLKRSRGEPHIDDYPGDAAAYAGAYVRWRELRRKNNEAVVKSRQLAQQRKKEAESVCARNEAENAALQAEVRAIRDDIAFLSQV